jgi:molybdenum cofactor synthesis domain-containing protein
MTDARPTTAAIVIIGSEVLSGKVRDENTPFLVDELRRLGVQLNRVVIIPDDIDTIAGEVRKAADEHDWVFTTGGLGPTHDDMTMEAIALAFDTELEQSEELLEQLNMIKRDRPIEGLMRLTWIPKGAELFWGDGERIWPTVHMNKVYIFPGVPSFLRHRFAAMRDLLRTTPFICHNVYCSESESEIVDQINAVVNAHSEVEVGSYPQFGNADHRVRITFDARDGEVADRALSHFLSLIDDEMIVRVVRDRERDLPYS